MTRHRLIALLALLLSGGALAQAPGYHYEGRVRIDDRSGELEAEWRIAVLDTAPGQRTFLLRDTIDQVQVSGDIMGHEVGSAEGLDAFTAVTVALDPAAARPRVRIAYRGVPIPEPMDNDINGIEPGRVELNVDSFWFPIDARFNQLLTAELTVEVPGEDWQAVTTGSANPVDGGFRLVNRDPRLDIAFTLSTGFEVTAAEGFTVYDQRSANGGTDKLVATAAWCRDFLNERWGADHPLPASRLLIAERDSSGYARQNYIVFTDIAETTPPKLTRFVCHEFAHYWASGGKFDTVDNWINEGFAEYLGLMAVRERLGQNAFGGLVIAMKAQLEGKDLPPTWVPGDTERKPYLVNYRKAPLALADLEEQIGQETFLAFTQALLAQPVKTTPGLLDTLETVAGAEARAWFTAALAR